MQNFNEFYKLFLEGKLKPLNERRRILLEAQYILPSTGDKAIMDVYALYALWWEIGAGKETAGYEQPNIRNHKVVERINRFFEEALVVVANTLLQESKAAIVDEAENIFDSHLIPAEAVIEWFKENSSIRKLQEAYNNGQGGNWFNTFSYNETANIFSADFWSKYADMYGGQKWEEITEAVKKLDNATRRGSVKDLMYIFDRLMDLEHNTGSLSSKLHKMKVDKKTLDLRAGFRSVQDFLPYVSPQVTNLIGLIR